MTPQQTLLSVTVVAITTFILKDSTGFSPEFYSSMRNSVVLQGKKPSLEMQIVGTEQHRRNQEEK